MRIVHHWDTDGICSAAMLKKIFPESSNICPRIGEYSVKNLNLDSDAIIVDLSISIDEINSLPDMIKIYDHHTVKNIVRKKNYFNPIYEGRRFQDFPSCTYVIKKYFNMKHSFLVDLGVVGDLGIKAKPLYEDFDEYQEAVNLIDSNYQMNDRMGVIEAVNELAKSGSLTKVLRNEKWRKGKMIVKEEIKKWLEVGADEEKGIYILRINTNFQIVSAITRTLYYEEKMEPVIVVNDRTGHIYLRWRYAGELLDKLKSDKWRCGGKSNVIGIECYNSKDVEYAARILRRLVNEKNFSAGT